MQITNHAYSRYIERILNITDEMTAKQYFAMNKDKLTKDIFKMFENGSCIYTGQIMGDKTSKNYILTGGNIVLVVTTDNSTIITLYKVDFGFGEKTDKMIVENLVEEINILRECMNDKRAEIDDDLERKRVELDNVNIEIQSLKERIFMLEHKATTINNEIKVMYNEVETYNKQLEIHALKVCNSLEYKKDLQKLSAGK